MPIPDTAAAAQFGLPDSSVAVAARQLAYDVSPEFVYNHAVRSYLFARELSAADGIPDAGDDEFGAHDESFLIVRPWPLKRVLTVKVPVCTVPERTTAVFVGASSLCQDRVSGRMETARLSTRVPS